MICPNCGAGMSAETFTTQIGNAVTIDFCLPCQVFWFDTFESLKLSPAAVLELFRVIGEHAVGAQSRTNSPSHCPRCATRLLLTHDQQRSTRFRYLRCPRNHGRLISFVEFLREKDFIRPLSPRQIEELRRNVQTVNCSNCGAPIDLATHAACGHCGSPLSMLDLQRAGALVVELQQEADRAGRPFDTDQESAQGRPIDPALPLELARARQQVEAAFASFERDEHWFSAVSQGGLVAAGLSSLARWLRDRD